MTKATETISEYPVPGFLSWDSEQRWERATSGAHRGLISQGGGAGADPGGGPGGGGEDEAEE